MTEKKLPKYNPSIPIDAKQPKRKGKGKGKKQPSKYYGLGSAVPRGGSRSIVTRMKTRFKGTTSGGLPSLGKKRK
jgi:hypothetical protein